MTPLKVIGASIAALLLLPVLVISAVAGGFGDVAENEHAPLVLDVGELAAAVLSHPGIHLAANARADIERGVVDPRVLHLLLLLAQSFELGPVGPLITGHSYYVKGTTRVSNHMFGRAVDILGVNGAPVSPANPDARELMEAIIALPEEMQPDELGGPWVLSNGTLTSFKYQHDDHVHAGWRSG